MTPAEIIRKWVAEVAYAEDDFVLTVEDDFHVKSPVTGRYPEIINLLDQLDPDWREAFTVTSNRF